MLAYEKKEYPTNTKISRVVLRTTVFLTSTQQALGNVTVIYLLTASLRASSPSGLTPAF